MATTIQQPPMEGTYTFTSSPRAVKPNQPKYRTTLNKDEEDDEQRFGNIMYDRRVIRGNTYALQRSLAALQAEVAKQLAEEEHAKRKVQHWKERAAAIRAKLAASGSRGIVSQASAIPGSPQRLPQPGEGIEAPEHLFDLIPGDPEDLKNERGWYDPSQPRPLSPPYMTGTQTFERETQIFKGDLFDFEREVVPILEVLVGRSVEQSLLEVQEEDELRQMREQRRAFEELRNAELCEQQRLAEQHRRLEDEKRRRREQHEKTVKSQQEAGEKMGALIFSQSYLAHLIPSVFGTLSIAGYFFDPVEREVERDFMPWLMEATVERVRTAMTSRMLLDSLIRQISLQRQNKFALSEQNRKELRFGLRKPQVEEVKAPSNVSLEKLLSQVIPPEADASPLPEGEPATEGEPSAEEGEKTASGRDKSSLEPVFEEDAEHAEHSENVAPMPDLGEPSEGAEPAGDVLFGEVEPEAQPEPELNSAREPPVEPDAPADDA